MISWAARGWVRTLWRSGVVGRFAAVLLAAAPFVLALQPVIGFAIFGTLAFGIGLVLFAVVLWRDGLVPPVDRGLAAALAVTSLTWNTETASAFLLVAVGVLMATLALRVHRTSPVAVSSS